MNLKDRKYIKYINNMPKYDIGKMPTSSGYLAGLLPQMSFSSTPGYDYSNAASTQAKTNLTTTATTIGLTGTNLMNMLGKGYTSWVEAATSNVGTALKNGLVDSATGKLTDIGAIAAKNAGYNAIEGQVANSAITEAALKGSGQTVTKNGFNVLGKAAAGVGAAMSAIGLANDISGFSNRLTGQDAINATSKLTATKYGLTYDMYGGTDVTGMMNYTKALNTGSTLSMTTNGLGLGASIGSLIPGAGLAGTIVGGALGAIGGLVGGLFGSNKRKHAVENSINSALDYMGRSNLQSEAEAGSQGLRNLFASTHADTGNVMANKGKNAYNNGKPSFSTYTTEKDKVGKLMMLQTPDGIQPGIKRGEVGKDEVLIDTKEQKAHKVELGTVGVDNQSFGMQLGKESHFNPSVVLSATLKYVFDPKTKKMVSPAEFVAPWIGYFNRDIDMNIGKETKETNYKNALRMFNYAIDSQLRATLPINNSSAVYANNGKNKFLTGKELYVEPTNAVKNYVDMTISPANIMSIANGLLYSAKALNDVNKENPYYPNTFNPYAGPMPLKRMVDYTQLYRVADTANRLNIYSINNAGSLSAGQREFLRNSSNLRTAAAKAGIHSAQVEKQAEFDKDYDTAMRQIGFTNMQYANLAAAAQAAGFAKAVGAEQQLQAQATKNWYTTTRQAIQDMNTYNQYLKMLNLYDRLITNDEIAARGGNGGNTTTTPATTTVAAPTTTNQYGNINFTIDPELLKRFGWRSYLPKSMYSSVLGTFPSTYNYLWKID